MQTVDLRLLSQVVALPSAEQAANVLEQTSNPFLLVPTFSGIKEGLRDVVPGVVYPFSEQTIVLHLARLDGKQEAIAEAHRKLTELTRSLPEGSWQALKTSHRLKLFIERRALIKTDPSGTMSSAMADLQERVGALQAFGIPNALEVAQVEQKMGFQLNLDPAAIEARAKELEGLFYRVQVPVPQTYYDLPEDARKAFILIGKAMKLLDPPYRIMSNPFGEVFEEMVMGTPAFASLRPYYTRFAGVFDFLRPREHTPYGFLPGMENVARPEGGNLYPQGMTLDDFRKFVPEGSPLDLDYRVLFREDKEKGLVTIPYSQAFARWLSPAADLLEKAAKLLEKDFAHMAGYLRTAVQAFRANEFEKNDRAWVRLTEERMDMVVGAIEDYMDGLRGALTQPSGALLLESKDPIFEERVRNLRKAFPRFEKSLRIEEELKKPKDQRRPPRVWFGDSLFATGMHNGGAMVPIAWNEPNDAKVRTEEGFRVDVTANLTRARHQQGAANSKLLELAIDPGQRHLVTFDGLLYNVVFHEFGHGHGVEHVVGSNPKIPVWHALGEYSKPSGELVADFVGLRNAPIAVKRGLIPAELKDQMYVSYVYRCIGLLRRGTAGAHARGALIALNFLSDTSAIIINPSTGSTYVDLIRFPKAASALAKILLTLRGLGKKQEMATLFSRFGEDVPYGLETIYKEGMKGLPIDFIPEYDFEKMLEDHPQSSESTG